MLLMAPVLLVALVDLGADKCSVPINATLFGPMVIWVCGESKKMPVSSTVIRNWPLGLNDVGGGGGGRNRSRHADGGKRDSSERATAPRHAHQCIFHGFLLLE